MNVIEMRRSECSLQVWGNPLYNTGETTSFGPVAASLRRLAGWCLLLGTLVAPRLALGQENWTLQSPASKPPARLYPAVAYDSSNSNTVMFGGQSSITGGIVGDTWLWSNGNWTHVFPTTSPVARWQQAMEYDSAQGQAILFGGLSATGTYLGDTWAWDGTNWTLKSSSGPTPRIGSALVYDALHSQIVLFGGFDANGYTNDTWVWSWVTNAWSQLSPANSPSARKLHKIAYDVTHQQAVLFGGTDNNTQFADTWIWTGTNWSLQSPNTVPPNRYNHVMAFDPSGPQVLMFGGVENFTNICGADTWAWNGFDWTQLSPTTSPACKEAGGMDYDAATGEVLMFGGVGGTPADQTWLFGNPSAQTTVTINVPSGIQFTFAGKTYTGSQTINIGQGSYTLSTASPQSTGIGSQAVWVSWDDNLAQSHSVTVGSTAINITGTFQPQNFLTTSVSPSGAGSISPASGFYNAGAVVSVTASAILGPFSAWSGDCTGSGACSVTMSAPRSVTANFTVNLVNVTINVPVGVQFTFNGTTYTGSQTIAIPPGSYTLSTSSPQFPFGNTSAVWMKWSDGGGLSHSISTAVGTVTGTFQIQYFVGTLAAPGGTGTVTPDAYYDAGSIATINATPNPGYEFDYWALDCAGSLPFCLLVVDSPKNATAVFGRVQNWVQMFPPKNPTPRDNFMTAYDAGRTQTILFGGLQADGTILGDTWGWDGSNWTQRATTGPPAREAGTMAYGNGQMLLFGGDQGAYLSDTWMWNGASNTWTQMQPTHVPGARNHSVMAYDGHGIVLFGGNGAGNVLLSDTWVWNGHDWVLQPGPSPSVRELAAMAFDTVRQRVVLFGGIGAAGPLSDTWEWDGTHWSLKPAITHPGTSIGTMAYNEASRQVLFFGDDGITWGWDGHNWIQKTPVTNPPHRGYTSMVYDAARQEVLFFGGLDQDTNHVYKDTWAWLTPVIDLVLQAPSVTKNGGNYVVTMGLKNNGNVPITGLLLSDTTLNGIAGKSNGFVSVINPGASASVSSKFSASFPPFAVVNVVFSGLYNADGIIGIPWSATFPVLLP